MNDLSGIAVIVINVDIGADASAGDLQTDSVVVRGGGASDELVIFGNAARLR